MPDGRMKRERLFHYVQGWDALERLFHLFGSFRPTDNNLARDGTNREHESLVRIIGIMGFGRLVARVRARTLRAGALSCPPFLFQSTEALTRSGPRPS